MKLLEVKSDGRRALRQIGWVRLVLTAAFLALAFWLAHDSWKLPMLNAAERALFDSRQNFAAPVVAQDDRVVIIAYTDQTLIKTGNRSPVDRKILAKALAQLDRMGAKAIGIDILIDQARPEDPQVVQTMRSLTTPTFLAYATVGTAKQKILQEQQDFLDAFMAQLAGTNVRPASVVLQTDNDNVLRRWPDLPSSGPPRMVNAMAPEYAAFAEYQGSIAFRIPKDLNRPVFTTFPIDLFDNEALVSAANIEQFVKGRYVLIGGNILDLDVFQTPQSRLGDAQGHFWSIFGIESFAHMLTQMMDGERLKPLPGWLVTLLTLLALLGGMATATMTDKPWRTALSLIVQIGLLIGLPIWLAAHGTDTHGLPAFGWVLGWLLAFAAVGMAMRAIGSEQRRFAQNAFGKYLPRDVAAQIMRDPENLSLTGEKREIFVIFSDLQGFTKLSHAIAPEMVALLLNRYLDMLSNVVLAHGGTIDKFVGDAVVAFWGAPISRADDGARAVKAAIAMYQAGQDFRNSVPEGVPPIGVTRVGLHFGEAVVGNFGGEGRIQYTALGDSMNTAARLESANKQTQSCVLVSREAVEASGLDIFRPLGRVVLRGRATPVDIFEPVPDWTAADRARFAEMAALAMSGNTAAIRELAKEADRKVKDTALSAFVDRLRHQEKGGYFVLD